MNKDIVYLKFNPGYFISQSKIHRQTFIYRIMDFFFLVSRQFSFVKYCYLLLFVFINDKSEYFRIGRVLKIECVEFSVIRDNGNVRFLLKFTYSFDRKNVVYTFSFFNCYVLRTVVLICDFPGKIRYICLSLPTGSTCGVGEVSPI